MVMAGQRGELASDGTAVGVQSQQVGGENRRGEETASLTEGKGEGSLPVMWGRKGTLPKGEMVTGDGAAVRVRSQQVGGEEKRRGE